MTVVVLVTLDCCCCVIKQSKQYKRSSTSVYSRELAILRCLLLSLSLCSKFVVSKTILLYYFASGKRIAELHHRACSRSSSWSKRQAKVKSVYTYSINNYKSKSIQYQYRLVSSVLLTSMPYAHNVQYSRQAYSSASCSLQYSVT